MEMMYACLMQIANLLYAITHLESFRLINIRAMLRTNPTC